MEETAEGRTVPKYVLIYRRIRQDILSGKYPEGGFLPTEAELMDAYGASRTTIRSAVKRLKDDNLLRTTQGRGTEVLPVQRQSGYDFSLQGRTTVATNFAGRSTDDIVGQPSTIDVVAPPDTVREALGTDEDETVYRLQREKIIDGEPFLYVISYLRRTDFPGLEAYDGQIYFLYKFLEEHYGTTFSSTEIDITAACADYVRSRLLNTPVGAPLLVQTRHTRSADRVIEVSHSYCRPEYMSITVTTSPEDLSLSPFLTRGF
ncbi:GntR family transcriptional regulator [Bifidobacterium sp. SO4]|uniref:GntR family transcriptional regulator n=1 Tax=Bifidobacterium sp. SO4 TaxID=2809030 RepID=UPI001BDBEF33|nr:GntR family transcriptional regulator [Bifidobacterium sp. SO4]MBT1170666.1 GntR family transcriptional regulator [Bifidobacterium sp. SO4]